MALYSISHFVAFRGHGPLYSPAKDATGCNQSLELHYHKKSLTFFNILLLLGHPTIVGRSYLVPLGLFNQFSFQPPSSSASAKVCQRLSTMLNLFNSLGHFVYSSQIFRGMKSPKFGHDFWPKSPRYRTVVLKTKHWIRNGKHSLWSLVIGLYLSNSSTVWPHLWEIGAAWKMIQQNLLNLHWLSLA